VTFVKTNVIPGYVDANLIGAAQVFFFQNNSFMGSMVLIAILWALRLLGTLTSHSVPSSVCLSIRPWILLTVDRAPLQQSLCGVNVILVGIAVPTLVNHPWSITR
jgi:urea transporter